MTRRESPTVSCCSMLDESWGWGRSSSCAECPRCRAQRSKRSFLPSLDRFGWLVRKDARELLASRAFWFLLIVVGLLVGQAFHTATHTYAEFSGAGGGVAVLSQGLSPLDGIVVPTFSAYDLAATLLLPFVVIRL